MKKNTFSLSILSALAIMVAALMGSSSSESTLILYNGIILTMDENNPQVTAIAITNDMITKLGSDAEVLATKGPKTRLIDLEGNRTVLPGFIEPHSHPDMNSLAQLSKPILKMNPNDAEMNEPILNISPIGYYSDKGAAYSGQLNYSKDLKPLIDERIIEKKKKKTDHDRSLVMFGWDPMFFGSSKCRDTQANLPWLDDMTDPDMTPAKLMDNYFDDSIPIALLLQSMHTLYVNTKWIKVYNLSAVCDKLGNLCGKDKQGEPNGRFQEAEGVFAALNPYFKNAKFILPFKKGLEKTIEAYHKAGISTVGVMGTKGGFIEDKLLWLFAVNKIRMGVFIAGSIIDNPNSSSLSLQQSIDNDLSKQGVSNNAWVKVLGTKLWYDGSPYSGSMFMSCEYEQYYLTGWLPEQLGIPQYAEHPYQNCGHSNFKDKEEEAKFQKAVTSYAGQGMIAVHTQGSQAAENTLEVYCNAQKAIGESFGKEEQKVRYRLEHAVFLSDDEICTAKGLDVHLSFHVLHLYWYGADFKELLNSRALKSVMPIKEALKMGHRFSFHTDSPQYPPDPLLTVRTAVTRRTFKNEDDQPYDKNGISVDDALKAITIDAAYSLNLDHLIGSLKVGKKADLVVLMNNPKTVAPGCIHKIPVNQLFVDGKQVWPAEK